MSACDLGHLPVVNFLLENGADITRTDARRSTPALEAATRGYTEILRALINKGADLSHVEAQDGSLLETAMSKAMQDCVSDSYHSRRP